MSSLEKLLKKPKVINGLPCALSPNELMHTVLTDSEITEHRLRLIGFNSPESCETVLRLIKQKILSLQSQYGFISPGWKPIPVSHPWLYALRREANIKLKERYEDE